MRTPSPGPGLGHKELQPLHRRVERPGDRLGPGQRGQRLVSGPAAPASGPHPPDTPGPESAQPGRPGSAGRPVSMPGCPATKSATPEAASGGVPPGKQAATVARAPPTPPKMDTRRPEGSHAPVSITPGYSNFSAIPGGGRRPDNLANQYISASARLAPWPPAPLQNSPRPRLDEPLGQ